MCVPIPDASTHDDLSTLEVVWPERRDSTSERLCHCPPFEGDGVFSKCVSTSSCATDYSIAVVNSSSVCVSNLSGCSPGHVVALYFTVLRSPCRPHPCFITHTLSSYLINTTGSYDIDTTGKGRVPMVLVTILL